MPFIGNQPALSFTSFAKQDFTTSATTSYTLDNPVANANELALFINFVRQEPTTAYSASGTTLTLTSATSASDDMYCVYLGKAVQTVNPPNASVGTAQLVDDAVTKDKLISHNYPAFEAYLSSNQTVSDGVDTKVQFDTKVFDTDNCYDNTTNYRFTPNVAGKYMIYGSLRGSANTNLSNLQKVITFIFKNGSQYNASQFRIDFRNNNGTQASTPFSQVLEFNGTTDYVEIFAHTDVSSDTPIFQRQSTFFGAYRIGD